MWNQRERNVVVAVEKDKSSQNALKWALDNIASRHQSLKLLHVKDRTSASTLNVDPSTRARNDETLVDPEIDPQIVVLMLPFRCLCRRRRVQCESVVIDDTDVAKGLIRYIRQNGVEILLLGSGSKNGLARLFKTTDISGSVMKWAPDFCTVYVISKGKVSAVRNAIRPLPPFLGAAGASASQVEPASTISTETWYDELSTSDTEIPLGSSGRSTDSAGYSFYEHLGSGLSRDASRRSKHNRAILPSDASTRSGYISDFDLSDLAPPGEPSYGADLNDLDTNEQNMSLNNAENYEDELKRLRTELKQTMDMYHAACREALAAKHKATELEKWKKIEEKKLLEASLMEENALTMAIESEKAKYMAAIEAAEAAQKIVEIEVEKRVKAEMNALREAEEKKKVLDALGQSHLVFKYQSLFHIVAVLFLFYVYFSL